MVLLIGDVEVARPVHRYASGGVKPGRGGRTSVAAEAGRSRARDGGDLPRRIHLADPVVRAIGDVEVARLVHRHFIWGIQHGLGCQTAISNPAGDRFDPVVGLRLRQSHCGE